MATESTPAQRIMSIAQAIYDYLKANRVGAQTTTSEALADAFPDNLPIQSEEDLWDINAVTEKTGDTYRLTLSAETRGDTQVTCTLEGHGIQETKTVETADCRAEAVFEGLQVTEWNAEQPTLYSVYYQTPAGCVKEAMGFKTV